MKLDQLIQGNEVVQRHVAAERQKQALTAVSPMARRAIHLEILPQIEEGITSIDGAEEISKSTKQSIQEAFSFKNEIYTRLISYKSIDQSDQQFLDDLFIVMDEWLRSTKATLEGEQPENRKVEEKPQAVEKVEITLKVETNTPDTEIEFLDTETGEKLPVSIEDIFDLQEMRL